MLAPADRWVCRLMHAVLPRGPENGQVSGVLAEHGGRAAPWATPSLQMPGRIEALHHLLTPALETVLELHQAVKAKFPLLCRMADEMHLRRWGEFDPELSYAWFESLAQALNREMSRQIDARVHRPLLSYLSGVLPSASEPVRQCIDVAFVENLFWQVPQAKCRPYWECLPPRLRALYLDFHRREP